MITDKRGIKMEIKLTATVLVLCMILSGFSILSMGVNTSVSAVTIEETESMNGTLIWNDTYFLTEPVNIMLPNADDNLTNHFPTVYKDKVAWTEKVNNYNSVVYYNMTTGVYEYINDSANTRHFYKPILTDNYLICFGFGLNPNIAIFDYTDLDVDSPLTIWIPVYLLATDFYDTNNEYVTWIDETNTLNVLNLSTIYDITPTINQYDSKNMFVSGLEAFSPIGNPSINENNDIIFPFYNGTNLNENYGLIKFNADTELWEVLRWEEQSFGPSLKWYGMYRNDIWFGLNNTIAIDLNNNDNLDIFNVETDEMLYETNLSWSGNPIAGGYYPLGFDGIIGTAFLYAYTVDNWTNWRDELQLINLETGENYTIKQGWNIDTWDNYIEDYISSTSTRYNVYAYANGSYAIVDCNYAFNPPTRSYDPDGISPSIMVMYLHPVDEEVDESVVVDEDVNIYVVLQGTLIALFVQLILPLIIIMIVIRMVMNIMKDTTKGKKKK